MFFFIIWGTNSRQEYLGAVADWCLSCREACPFTVVSHYRVSHIYYIPLGQGKLVATFRECWRCGSQFHCAAQKYDQFVPAGTAEKLSMRELLQRTNLRLKNLLDANQRRQSSEARRTAQPANEAEIPFVGPVDDGKKVRSPSDEISPAGSSAE